MEAEVVYRRSVIDDLIMLAGWPFLVVGIIVAGLIVCVYINGLRRSRREEPIESSIWWCWSLSVWLMVFGIMSATWSLIVALHRFAQGGPLENWTPYVGSAMTKAIGASAIVILGLLSIMSLKLINKESKDA